MFDHHNRWTVHLLYNLFSYSFLGRWDNWIAPDNLWGHFDALGKLGMLLCVLQLQTKSAVSLVCEHHVYKIESFLQLFVLRNAQQLCSL